MKLNKKAISILSLSIITSTTSFAQLRPGPPSGPVQEPPPNVQPAPPAPAKKILDPRELDGVVRRSSEMYTRDVLDILGYAYNVRYNIRQGIFQAKARMGDYDIIENVRRSMTYTMARQAGQGSGTADGRNAGARAAETAGRAMADADISAAVDAAIDSHQAIVFNPNPRPAPYAGSDANISYPATMQVRWANDRMNKEGQIQRQLMNRLPYELFRYIFDLTGLYQQDIVTVPDMLRGDMAFRNFMQNSLGTMNPGLEDARRFFRQISDPNQYENADQNARMFSALFVQYYSRGIENMWTSRVMAPNFSARNLGDSMYSQDAESFANELGSYDGYILSYREATLVGFKDNILSAYSRNFEQIKQAVQTSAYISQVQASVVPEIDGKTEFGIGDTFDVILNQISNRGMVGTDVKIDIATGGVVTSMGLNTSLNMPGLSKINTPNRYIRLGWISDMTAPDQTVTVTATINGQAFSGQFRMTFEEAVRKLATSPDANMQSILAGKLSNFIKAQFDDISGFKDQYKNRRPDMLLVRMRAMFDGLPDAQKAQLRANGQAIRNAFGKKPGNFLGLNPKRNEWDEAQKMINEMQLGGSVPK